MSKYIFLDFDGVLNTGRHRKFLEGSGTPSCDRFGVLFDPEAVSCLKSVVERTGARVCVTSSWALEMGPERLPAFWKERSLPGILDGTTAGIPVDVGGCFAEEEDFDPYRILEGGSLAGRGGEISAYLERKGASDAPYVILDDVPDFRRDQERHFVRINPETGITPEDADRAVAILESL